MVAIAWQHVWIGVGVALGICLVFTLAWWLFHPSAEKRAQKLFRKYTRPEDRFDWSRDRARTDRGGEGERTKND